MHKYFFSFLAASIFLLGCGPEPKDSSLKILGYEKQKDAVLVNLDLRAYSRGDLALVFAVSDDEPRVLTLQLENGLEIEPDIKKTLELPKSCGNIYKKLPWIELSCQVAFKTTGERKPKKLYYRSDNGYYMQLEASF